MEISSLDVPSAHSSSPSSMTLAMLDNEGGVGVESEVAAGTGAPSTGALSPFNARRLGWSVITVLLLSGSSLVMITAWFLHLKFDYLSMPLAILISWLIAGGEYALQVPANRIGARLC